MNPSPNATKRVNLTPTLITIGLVAVLSLCLFASNARAFGGAAARPDRALMTAKGIGAVHLQARYGKLHRHNRVGALSGGCELNPKTTYYAPLKGRLAGGVTFNARKKIIAISVSHGAQTGRGVHPGTSLKRVKRKYKLGTYFSASPSDPIPFGVFTVKRKNGKPKFMFLIDATTHKVAQMAVPSAQICE